MEDGVCGVVFSCWARCWIAGEVIPDWTGMRRSVGAHKVFPIVVDRRDDCHMAVELTRSCVTLAVVVMWKSSR
jgi:hypothetical protein